MTHMERYGHEKIPTGRAGRCHVCSEKARRRYAAANAEKRLAQARTRRAANPGPDRERTRAWRAANPEKVLAGQRAYRAANREKLREQKRAWYAANIEREREKANARRAADPEKVRAWAKAWRAANIEHARKMERAQRAANVEKERAVQRRWYLENPEKARAAEQRRRAMRGQAKGSHTADDVKNQLARQKHRCYWCRASVRRVVWHLDHVVPLAKGGTNGPENIVIACPQCNLSKGSKMPEEWAGRLL